MQYQGPSASWPEAASLEPGVIDMVAKRLAKHQSWIARAQPPADADAGNAGKEAGTDAANVPTPMDTELEEVEFEDIRKARSSADATRALEKLASHLGMVKKRPRV